jgi:hypothetical protein
MFHNLFHNLFYGKYSINFIFIPCHQMNFPSLFMAGRREKEEKIWTQSNCIRYQSYPMSIMR